MKEYLKEKQLPIRYLLAMDNATALSRYFDDDLPDGMGLEVESVDVLELMKSLEIELNTEEQQKTLADDVSSDEDEVRESVMSSLIKEMCSNRGEVICGKITSGHHHRK